MGSVLKVGVGLGSRGRPQAVRGTENRPGHCHSGACCAAFLPGNGLSATMSEMILAACSAAVPSQACAGSLTLAPSTALPIESPPNRWRHAQSPAISENTAPIIPMGDLLLGSTCTTRLRCLSSQSARSRTLLVRSLTWCSWGGDPDGPGRRPRPLPAPRPPWGGSLYLGGGESVEALASSGSR